MLCIYTFFVFGFCKFFSCINIFYYLFLVHFCVFELFFVLLLLYIDWLSLCIYICEHLVYNIQVFVQRLFTPSAINGKRRFFTQPIFCAGNLNFGRFVNCQLNIYLCYADTKDTTKLNNMKVQKTMSTFAHHWFSVSLSRLSSVFFYMCSPCFISIVKYLLNRLMLTK